MSLTKVLIVGMVGLLIKNTESQVITNDHANEGDDNGDPCGAKVVLNADRKKANVFQFDLCDMIDCGEKPKSYRGYDVYGCPFAYGYPRVGKGSWCHSWRMDGWWWSGSDTSWLSK